MSGGKVGLALLANTIGTGALHDSNLGQFLAMKRPNWFHVWKPATWLAFGSAARSA
jgi:hypothetical protein